MGLCLKCPIRRYGLGLHSVQEEAYILLPILVVVVLRRTNAAVVVFRSGRIVDFRPRIAVLSQDELKDATVFVSHALESLTPGSSCFRRPNTRCLLHSRLLGPVFSVQAMVTSKTSVLALKLILIFWV